MVKPLRVAHVYKDYFPVLGGIENHVRVLAEAQARQGHTVTVLVTNSGPRTVEETLNGVRVIKAGRLATVASTPLSVGLPARLRRQAADLFHLHAPYPMGELAQWMAGGGRPYVVTYHADPTRRVQQAIMRLYGPLFRRVLHGAARVVATSPAYAASSPNLRGLGDRLAIVPLGVDEQRFRPGPARRGQPFTLLFVGQLRHYKGLDDLLRALPQTLPETRLLVAGTGPRQATWQALCAGLGLGGRVEFLGRVADEALPDLYHAADAFVLPANSRAEAFGTVLLEAMASGLACLTTEVGSGTSYVVAHEQTGLVVAPRDPAGLAAAVTRLAADPALCARLGAAGRARVEREFTQDRMVARVADLYAAAAQK